MRLLIYILMIFPLFVNGQSLYSGKDKFKRDFTLQIDRDSSIFLIQKFQSFGYNEYKGMITKINDTLFNIKAKLVFSQGKCRAIGDSVVYITIGPNSAKEIKNFMLTYSNGQMESIPNQGQKQLLIPLDKKLFNSDSTKNYFIISVGHKNPLNNKQINTVFKIGEEYCIEFYANGDVDLKIVIKKNIIRNIDNRTFDKFVLKKSFE